MAWFWSIRLVPTDVPSATRCRCPTEPCELESTSSYPAFKEEVCLDASSVLPSILSKLELFRRDLPMSFCIALCNVCGAAYVGGGSRVEGNRESKIPSTEQWLCYFSSKQMHPRAQTTLVVPRHASYSQKQVRIQSIEQQS